MPAGCVLFDANRLTLSVNCVSRRYQDYQASDIPIVADQGVSVRVMAGEYFGTTGPIALRNPGMLLDVILSPGATFTQAVRPSASHAVCTIQALHAGQGWPAMTALNSIQIPSKTLHVCCHNITADDMDA